MSVLNNLSPKETEKKIQTTFKSSVATRDTAYVGFRVPSIYRLAKNEIQPFMRKTNMTLRNEQKAITTCRVTERTNSNRRDKEGNESENGTKFKKKLNLVGNYTECT